MEGEKMNADTFFCGFLSIVTLAAAYSIRGGWEALPLPNWGLQLAGRLGVWGGGLATTYIIYAAPAVNLWTAAWFMVAGFGMMFIPHSYVMTAGMTRQPPQIIKPNLEQHWPTIWFSWQPTQAQWDDMPLWQRTLNHSLQTAFIVLLRALVIFVPYVLIFNGAAHGAMVATAIIVALCPLSNILGFRIIPKDKPWDGATKAEEVIHGAVWGFAFTQL